MTQDATHAAKDLLASLDPDTLNPEQFNAWHALDAALRTSDPVEAAAPSEEPVAWLKEFRHPESPKYLRRRVDLERGAEAWMTDYRETPLFASPAVAPVAWTGHQLAKLNDFKGCLEEHEGMLCASTAKRVREAAIDFALSVVLREAKP